MRPAAAPRALGAVALALVFATACERAPRPARYAWIPTAELPPRPAFAYARGETREEPTEITLSGPLVGAPAVRREVYAVQQSARTATRAAHSFLYGSPNASTATAAPPTDDAAHASKIEREAQLTVGVADVNVAADTLVALVRDRKGFVAKDERSRGGQPIAQLVVRVPAAELDAVLAAIAKLGEVKAQSVRAVDATLEHKDVEVLVANLEAAHARYKELLQRAAEPGQVLAVERELERVRTDLERVQARLALLRDRVAFATVAVAFAAPTPEQDLAAGYRPHIATGVRGVSLVDVREGGTNAYAGAGLTLRFPRSTGDAGRGLAFDVDVMRACCGSSPDRSRWGFTVMTGFDLYSESLESGGRRFLNPYVGARLGVAETQDRLDFAAAAVFGVELVKTRALTLDLQLRALAFVGNPDGPHGGVAPSLGFDAGF